MVEEHQKGVKQEEKALAISKASLERFQRDVQRMEGQLKDRQTFAIEKTYLIEMLQ